MIKLPDLSDHEELKFMWMQCPYCFWCGRLTKIYYVPQPKRRNPNNMATRDHLFAKWDIRRMYYKASGGGCPKVICCHKCNEKRNNIILEEFLKIMNREINFSEDIVFY
jgi:hypothetical protein